MNPVTAFNTELTEGTENTESFVWKIGRQRGAWIFSVLSVSL